MLENCRVGRGCKKSSGPRECDEGSWRWFLDWNGFVEVGKRIIASCKKRMGGERKRGDEGRQTDGQADRQTERKEKLKSRKGEPRDKEKEPIEPGKGRAARLLIRPEGAIVEYTQRTQEESSVAHFLQETLTKPSFLSGCFFLLRPRLSSTLSLLRFAQMAFLLYFFTRCHTLAFYSDFFSNVSCSPCRLRVAHSLHRIVHFHPIRLAVSIFTIYLNVHIRAYLSSPSLPSSANHCVFPKRKISANLGIRNDLNINAASPRA